MENNWLRARPSRPTKFPLIELSNFISADNYQAALVSERHTDFVFTSLRENSSVASGLVAVLSIGMVIYLFSRAQEITNQHFRTLLVGSSAVLATGIFWGISSNLGFVPMPITGVNFPFLSYGGSTLMGNMALIGIMVGILRRKKLCLIE